MNPKGTPKPSVSLPNIVQKQCILMFFIYSCINVKCKICTGQQQKNHIQYVDKIVSHQINTLLRQLKHCS